MEYFSVEKLTQMADQLLVPFAIDLVLAILVFYFGRMIARFIVRLIDRITTRASLDETLRRFIGNLVYALLLAVVIIAALERLGVKTTAAIAIIGAAGLAIGLALQGSLGNFAAGVLLVMFKPYRIGDVVSVAGHTGKVNEINIFNTVLTTPDNRVIIVPNGAIMSGSIENITRLEQRRIDLEIGVGYGDDLAKAKSTIEKVLAEEPRVLAEPAPVVAVTSLGDSSVNLVVRPWVKTPDYWPTRFHLTEQIKLALDKNDISIPFPQRDIHVFNQSAATPSVKQAAS